MKHRDFSNCIGRLPFLIKRAAVVITFSAVASAAIAASDIQQADNFTHKELLRQGDKHYKRGDYEAAEKAYRRASAIEPENAGTRLKIAMTALKQRRIRDAYDISYEIAKADNKNSDAFAVLGATLLTAGKFPEARAMFNNALFLNRKEALAWAGVGMLDFYENRIQDSLDALWQARVYDPGDPDFVFAFAQVASRAEKYTESADAYYRFLELSKNTDDDRRARIKGLINFLRFLGSKSSLYTSAGEPETKVNFKLVGNRPVIQLRVNDRPELLNFVLDTGSGISVISEKTAKRLKIKPVAKGGHARGIGGNGRFEIVYGFLKEVGIGDVNIRSVPVYIRKFHSDGAAVDGYIGLSLISKFLTTIDYGAETFALARKGDTPADAASEQAVTLPLRLTSSGFLSGEVQVEGLDEPLNFIVDTGASVSVISDDVASMEPINSFVKPERMRVIGSAGVTEDVPSFLLPRVSFGSHSRQGITAIALDLDMINEASGFEQAGILGGNFLRNYRMTFDFKNSRVTFVPVVAEP